MNWLQHPLAAASASVAGRVFAGRLGCLDTDDARQEGAIRAWQHGHDARAAKAVVINILRRVGGVSRNGTPRVDRTRDTAPLDDAAEVADSAPGPEQIVAQAQEMRRAAACLAAMPPRWQAVADGVLRGDDLHTIGQRLDPPTSRYVVSQMLSRIVERVEGRRLEPVVSRKPPVHRAKCLRGGVPLAPTPAPCDTNAIAAQAAAARAMYQQAMGE